MPIHILTLLERQTIANNTIECRFEKPSGFTFVSGQYGGWTLINPSNTDAGGITRRFSLLSAPHDPYLAITTRIQASAYKQTLLTMPLGDSIKFAGPTGSFILDSDSDAPLVFLAGGIGIAPFMSMIRHASLTQPNRPITLFYGNNTVDDAAYLDELFALQTDYFTFIPVLSNPPANWQGETGYIDEMKLRDHLRDLSNAIYYVCGSPRMVTALQEMLVEMGIVESAIRVEDFPGY